MKFRHLAAWFSVVALLGTTATFIRAQPPRRPNGAPVRSDREKLRAEIIRLRTEVGMLQLDYDLARGDLMEDMKLRKGLKMAGGLLQLGVSIQNSINEGGEKPPGEAPRVEAEQARKKAVEDAKKVEQAEKQEAAEEAAFIAERKKELARRMASLAEKQLDLEDAERIYRDTAR